MSLNIGSLFSVEGKTFVVTGGASGIGYMIADGLVQNGAKVYIVSRQEKYLKEASDKLSAAGPGSCHYLVCDLMEYEQVVDLAAKLAELEPQGIYGLVNNAGICHVEPIETHSDKQFHDNLVMDLQRPFTLSQLLLPLLKLRASEEDPARIIHISSISGMVVAPIDSLGYSAAKAGLVHLTREMSNKLAKDNITVNCIAPGPFPSRMTEKPIEEKTWDIKTCIPLGRIGNSADAAGAVIYLCSRAGSIVSGVTIAVDGGLTSKPFF
ncbi:short chain dehydrogenase/reductase family [Martensiomyces pterosporus]|nr:short chain dehydrogenase/reductase family [Martensiomyces pterosporus]